MEIPINSLKSLERCMKQMDDYRVIETTEISSVHCDLTEVYVETEVGDFLPSIRPTNEAADVMAMSLFVYLASAPSETFSISTHNAYVALSARM